MIYFDLPYIALSNTMQALCPGMVGEVVDGELQRQNPQEARCMEQQPRRGSSWLGKTQIRLFQQGVHET